MTAEQIYQRWVSATQAIGLAHAHLGAMGLHEDFSEAMNRLGDAMVQELFESFQRGPLPSPDPRWSPHFQLLFYRATLGVFAT